MEGERETVSVKWWNHRSALCRSIRDIYMKNLYADVKLVCNGHEYWVHKFVLSACSEYFETIMVDVPYQGSVKLAPSIRPKELLSLLDFMYLGIVDVLQQELPALVSAAEVLMIRGLAIPYEDDDSDEEDADKKKDSDSTKSKTESQVQKGNSCKRKRTEDLESKVKIEKIKIEEETFEYCADADLNPTTHSEPSTSNGGSVLAKIPDQNCQVTSSNAEVNAMLKVLIGKTPRRSRKKQVKGTEELKLEKPEESPKSPDSFTCCTCMKTFHWRSNLTKHMRTHTGEKPYSCNVCSYRTSYSEALKRHMRIHTGEKPYQCEYCDYKSRDHGSLKVHLKRHSFSSCNQLVNDDGQKDSNLASVNESLDLNLAPENDSQDSNLVINESVSSSDLTVQDAGRVLKSGGNENANDSLLNFENII